MDKRNIITLISLVTSLALVFVFVDPLWTSIKVLKTKLIIQEQEVIKIEELLLKTQQLEQEYQKADEEAQKIILALPKEKDTPFLLTQFEILALNNGLLLESVEFGQVDYEAEFPSSLVNLKISGSYGAFKAYLSALENSIRSMDVYLIKFAVRGVGQDILLSNLGIFEFGLGIRIYYQ